MEEISTLVEREKAENLTLIADSIGVDRDEMIGAICTLVAEKVLASISPEEALKGEEQ